MEYRIADEIGIDIRYTRLGPGVVPEYEACEAAIFGHHTIESFNDLTLEQKGLVIAQYRVHNHINNVVQNEVNRYMKARTK